MGGGTWEGHGEEEGVCPARVDRAPHGWPEDGWTGQLYGAGGRSLAGACEWEQAGPA